MREFAQHKIAYGSLMVGLLFLVMLYMAAWPNIFWQRVVAVGIGLFYVVWGVTTHLHADHINKHIIYEYLGIGVLGGALLLLITF
jgi:hypothetical protein